MTDISAIETDPNKLLAEAQAWAKELCKAAKRQTDAKADAVLNTAARWADVSPTMIWKLRYRPPNTVDAHIYNRLKLAYARYVKSPEATIAENLAELKALPSTPARDRLVAGMEEYLRASEVAEVRQPAE